MKIFLFVIWLALALYLATFHLPFYAYLSMGIIGALLLHNISNNTKK